MSPGQIPTYPVRIIDKISTVFYGVVLRMNWGKKLLLVSQALRYGLFPHHHITVINLTNPKKYVPSSCKQVCLYVFLSPAFKTNACASLINIFITGNGLCSYFFCPQRPPYPQTMEVSCSCFKYQIHFSFVILIEIQGLLFFIITPCRAVWQDRIEERLHHPAFIELPADLKRLISRDFTWDLRGFLQFTFWISLSQPLLPLLVLMTLFSSNQLLVSGNVTTLFKESLTGHGTWVFRHQTILKWISMYANLFGGENKGKQLELKKNCHF